jgi:hypothetical protein
MALLAVAFRQELSHAEQAIDKRQEPGAPAMLWSSVQSRRGVIESDQIAGASIAATGRDALCPS